MGRGGNRAGEFFESLATREGKSLPHVFSDGTLCLHEPGEWTDGMYIADTTVPWTAEWLANYEIWLATGTEVANGRRGGEAPLTGVLDADVKQPPAEAA